MKISKNSSRENILLWKNFWSQRKLTFQSDNKIVIMSTKKYKYCRFDPFFKVLHKYLIFWRELSLFFQFLWLMNFDRKVPDDYTGDHVIRIKL